MTQRHLVPVVPSLLRYDPGAQRPASRGSMSEITIDTTTYECKTGKKPVGRAFWTFKIISPTVTFKDHIFTTEKPVTFQAACECARELATLRRSDQIVLLPGD
jgi:hypothetical protein